MGVYTREIVHVCTKPDRRVCCVHKRYDRSFYLPAPTFIYGCVHCISTREVLILLHISGIKSGLDLSTLEVRSVRRSHSGLSGTGRGSSWKWKLGKLWAAPSRPGLSWSKLHPGRFWPDLGVSDEIGVPIGTQGTVLPYIDHTGGPHTFCMDRICRGRCAAFYKNPEVLLQKNST